MSFTTTDKGQRLQAFLELASAKEIDSEQIFIVNSITWEDYETVLEMVSDRAGISLKYCQGHLEIMSPSNLHEIYKENIGILLECYFLEKQIRFYSLGSTTFRSQSASRGIESDQSYCIQTRKAFPDLAIEVIITSGGLDCLEIYRELEVPEVWFWEQDQLKIYVLENQAYFEVKQSRLFPDLPLELLATYIPTDEPYDAVLEFRSKITN